jgi:hypothetical protein
MDSTLSRPAAPAAPAAAGSDGRFSPPVEFGPFLLHRLVRESAMSLLYEGVRKADGGPVAVKLCKSKAKADRKRFEREIALTRSIRIPGVVKILGDADLGETADGRLFYAAAWIKGPSLGEFLQKSDVTPDQKLDVFDLLCGIMGSLHAERWDGKPVTHRDLKPSNIKVTSAADGDRPVILDWGLACAEGDRELTLTGHHPGGTAGYCPPWSRKNPRLVRAHGKHWDVYSLAVILVEVLTGERPEVDPHDTQATDPRFTPQGVRNLLQQHLPADRRFDELLARCLTENPGQCPASAEKFLRAFRACRRRRKPFPLPWPWRRALRFALFAGLAGVLLYLGFESFRAFAPAQYEALRAGLRQALTPPGETPEPDARLISWTNFVLRVAVAPTGATVRVVNHRANGVVVTNLTAGPEGPLEIPLPDDADAQYSLEVFHPGHHPVTQPVDPQGGPVIIRLERLRGQIELVSTSGAVLELRHASGTARTAGPVPAAGRLLVQSLDEGAWDWRLSLADHASATGRIDRLQHGRPETLNRPLNPLPGRLSVLGPDDLEVWLAGRRLVASNGWLTLPAGDHELELRRPGFRAEALRLTLPPNRTLSRVAPAFTPLPDPPAPAPALAAAGERRPWTNSLGMRFLPVPGTDVLLSVWETRVQDFEAFVQATGHDATQGMFSLRKDGWKQRGDTWKSPGFPQGSTHPVVGVSYEDAVAFCRWLTDKERAAGRLPAGREYRLPTDAEWSAAVGTTAHPWGDAWPPPRDAGNYAGEEAKDKDWPENFGVIEGWRDAFPRTAPVGSFAPNALGLYDLGGNVWEWCADWYRKDLNTEEVRKLWPVLDQDQINTARVLRGASWDDDHRAYLASGCRIRNRPGNRSDHVGFRVVVGGSGR